MRLTHGPRVSAGEGRACEEGERGRKGKEAGPTGGSRWAARSTLAAEKTGPSRRVAQKEERVGKFLFIFFSKFPKQIFKWSFEFLLSFESNHSAQKL